MRQKIVAGNWKMNKTWDEGIALTNQVLELLAAVQSPVTVVLGSPFIHLQQVAALTSRNSQVHVAAQNCHQELAGAYTGEISAGMIQSVGAKYVILGHSERREYFGETNELIAQKVDTVLNQQLVPIFCCGEPLSIREASDQMEYVCHQLTASLFHLEPQQISTLVIAYEPIWAIGTGKTASALQAQEMHLGIREHLTAKFGEEIAATIPILYGGSCKPANAAELFAGADVDGGLIGGASLSAQDFVDIVKCL